jgi:hypothetical protein
MNRTAVPSLIMLVFLSCADDRDSPPDGPPNVSVKGRLSLSQGIIPSDYPRYCSLMVPDRDGSLVEICKSHDAARGLVPVCNPTESLAGLLEPGERYNIGRPPTLTASTSTTPVLVRRWRAAFWLSPRPDGIPEQPWALGLSRWVEVEAMDCPPTVAGPCFGAFVNDADIVIEGDQPPCP